MQGDPRAVLARERLGWSTPSVRSPPIVEVRLLLCCVVSRGELIIKTESPSSAAAVHQGSISPATVRSIFADMVASGLDSAKATAITMKMSRGLNLEPDEAEKVDSSKKRLNLQYLKHAVAESTEKKVDGVETEVEVEVEIKVGDQSCDVQDSAEAAMECELKADTGAAAAARERLGWAPPPRFPEQPISGGEPSGDQQQVMCCCSALLVVSEVVDAGEWAESRLSEGAAPRVTST